MKLFFRLVEFLVLGALGLFLSNLVFPFLGIQPTLVSSVVMILLVILAGMFLKKILAMVVWITLLVAAVAGILITIWFLTSGNLSQIFPILVGKLDQVLPRLIIR